MESSNLDDAHADGILELFGHREANPVQGDGTAADDVAFEVRRHLQVDFHARFARNHLDDLRNAVHMAHHEVPAHEAVGTARKFQIHQFSDRSLFEGGIFDRLVHQAKSGFVIGTRFYGKAHTVVSDAVAQFAIFKESRRLEAHRKRIATTLYRDDFASRLNNSSKHTRQI